MASTGRYNAGSVLPTMGRVGQISTDIMLPSSTLSQGESVSIQQDVGVGSGQLTNITIDIDGVAYVLNTLLLMDDDWRTEVWCERIDATTVRTTLYLEKHSSGAATHDPISATISLNAFDCP